MHETSTPHPAPLLARLPVTSVQGLFVEMLKTGERDDEVLPLDLLQVAMSCELVLTIVRFTT